MIRYLLKMFRIFWIFNRDIDEVKAQLIIVKESEQLLSQLKLKISGSSSSERDLLYVEKYLKRTKKILRIQLSLGYVQRTRKDFRIQPVLGFLERIVKGLFKTI